jgi:hypothetical protein
MPLWSEEERQARLFDRPHDPIGRRVELHSQRLEHIGAAAAARHGAIAVLGHSNTAAGDDDGRGSRDVEGVRGVAARAAGVEHLTHRRRQRNSARAHRPRESHHLGRALPFERESHQQAGDVRRLRLPIHDRAHRLGRVLTG